MDGQTVGGFLGLHLFIRWIRSLRLFKKGVLLIGWELGREVLVLCIGSVWFREKIWVTLFRLITAYFI